MKEAFCCLNTIAGKVGPSYRPHYLLHSILWAVSSLEHSRTLFPRIQNPTKAHLYTLHQLQTSQRPETLQRSNDSLLWAQIMNLFNGFHFIFTKYSTWLWRISQVVFSPPRKLWFDFWIYRGSYWIYYNLTTGILMCLNFCMVTVRGTNTGHCFPPLTYSPSYWGQLVPLWPLTRGWPLPAPALCGHTQHIQKGDTLVIKMSSWRDWNQC